MSVRRFPLFSLLLHACLLALTGIMGITKAADGLCSVPSSIKQNFCTVVRILNCTLLYLIIFKIWNCCTDLNEKHLHIITGRRWIKGASIWVEMKSYIKLTKTISFVIILTLFFRTFDIRQMFGLYILI